MCIKLSIWSSPTATSHKASSKGPPMTPWRGAAHVPTSTRVVEHVEMDSRAVWSWGGWAASWRTPAELKGTEPGLKDLQLSQKGCVQGMENSRLEHFFGWESGSYGGSHQDTALHSVLSWTWQCPVTQEEILTLSMVAEHWTAYTGAESANAPRHRRVAKITRGLANTPSEEKLKTIGIS